MTLGITRANFSPNSFETFKEAFFFSPVVATTSWFSAASAGGAQAAFSIASATNGTAVPLSAIATAAPLRYGRLPTITLTDASFGSAIVVTVRITGRRFGLPVVQDITATSVDTNPLVVTGTKVIDEVTSMAITSITNNTTSDTLSVGIDGTTLGLPSPIRTVRALKFLEKLVAASPYVANANSGATAGAAGAIGTTGSIRAGAVIQSSAYVNVADSSINVAALFNSVAIANGDVYIVQYHTSGSNVEYGVYGKKYA